MRIETTGESDTREQRQDRVAIAGAVAALFGRAARIRSIHRGSGHREGTWTRQGRLEIQTSHRMTDPLIALARERETRDR
jgi:hypothetical protein